MNIVLLHPEDARGEDDARFSVSDRRARHIREVLGAGVADRIRVGLVDGPLGTAEIVGRRGDAIELTCRWTGPAPRPWLDLVLAVPRPKQLRKLLPQVTALGLRRLTFLRTWRVQRPYLASPLLDGEGHANLFEEGLMQAGRTAWPRVGRFDRFEDFCADAIARTGRGGTRLLADPRATRDLAQRADLLDTPIELVIGPEGGLLPYEVQRLIECGFESVRSGSAILRTDTACVAIVAQLDLLMRRSSLGD
jgi:RsmE family RNA methyltransferase